MKIQIIVCHPNENSFNHAIANRVKEALIQNGHQIIFHDLYKEKFNPILTYEEITGNTNDPILEGYIDDLLQSDALIIVHPNWWGKPPALLSGWIDRVLKFNIAYTFPKGEEGGASIGLLKLQKVIVLNTANTTDDREREIFGNPLDLIWKNCVFEFCGIQNTIRKVFTVVVDSTLEERKKWLDEAELLVLNNVS
ncbi:NAD(P)H-dependent oxidoreductase [Tenacibaculum agarivorans]|uniref:NAD(P)H-dependent oxidoreductase n=1 Tax=Tenacibaculum agarivorans TaxID=1908389 RepID=UPI00094BA7B1|nr:NAD(P)H-dependent oxidoreductase [Tenacibaculum agarivorans]